MPAPKFPRALAWKNNAVRLLDQTRLPEEVVYVDVATPKEMFAAIRALVVRGAPAIGCAAAYGCLLTLLGLDKPTPALLKQLGRDADLLAKARPTAVNLFWALDRMRAKGRELAAATPLECKRGLLAEAHAILADDEARCAQIGDNLVSILPKRPTRRPLGILTHCNAGALATGGMGTALAGIYKAAEKKIPIAIFADETRPLLQGARLTAWELSQAGIPVTVICDNMAAEVMREGKVDIVIVGADRVAANGDVANKIGTLGLAVLAGHFKVPFYVAAPVNTFDLTLKNGAAIPIEQRDGEEVRRCGGRVTAAKKAGVFNPAFDVTPAELICGIVTERGVIVRPTAERVAAHFED